jgi:hypothetical protein
MLKSRLPLLLSLLVAVTASAQPAEKVLGRAAEVKGLVTVSNGAEVSGVIDGSPVVNGTRYITSSIGFVTLKFEHCEVRLRPNQSVVVDERRICDGMIAAIEWLQAPLPVRGDPLLAASIIGGGILVINGGQTPVNPVLSGQ